MTCLFKDWRVNTRLSECMYEGWLFTYKLHLRYLCTMEYVVLFANSLTVQCTSIAPVQIRSEMLCIPFQTKSSYLCVHISQDNQVITIKNNFLKSYILFSGMRQVWGRQDMRLKNQPGQPSLPRTTWVSHPFRRPLHMGAVLSLVSPHALPPSYPSLYNSVGGCSK